MTARAFPNEPESVARARHFATEAALGTPIELRERLELLVSELATNAIHHAHSAFSVSVEVTGDVTRVEVADGGVGTPEMLSPAPDVPSGRGLRIVETLADQWGIASEPDGKTVWFVLTSSESAAAPPR